MILDKPVTKCVFLFLLICLLLQLDSTAYNHTVELFSRWILNSLQHLDQSVEVSWIQGGYEYQISQCSVQPTGRGPNI